MALLSLVLAITAGAAAAQAFPRRPLGDMQRVKDGVAFEGPLYEENYVRLAAMLRDGDTLYIDSNAGDPEAALKFGRLVLSRHIRVHANTCVQACADYVFLAAPRRHMSGPHAVGFSTTFEMALRGFRQRPDLSDPAELARVSALVQAHTALLKDAGVDLGVLSCIETALGPHYDTFVRGAGPPPLPILSRDFGMKTDKDLVFLTRVALAQFGATASGDFGAPTPGDRKAARLWWDPWRTTWVDDRNHCKGR